MDRLSSKIERCFKLKDFFIKHSIRLFLFFIVLILFYSFYIISKNNWDIFDNKPFIQRTSQYTPVQLSLKSFEELPALSKGVILLQDLDGNTVSTSTKISKKRTTQDIYEKNNAFLEKIKENYGWGLYFQLKNAKSRKPRSTEQKLPEILEEHSKRGVCIIPFSSRGAKGVENTKKQLSELGYNYTAWNAEKLNMKEGSVFGDFIFVQNMILNVNSKKPNKGIALNTFLRALEEENILPSAVYFIDDGEKNIKAALNSNPNPPVPLFLFLYEGEEKFFDSPKKVKDFYKETIPDFEIYENIFDDIFGIVEVIPLCPAPL
ncbi:MAG: DUF2608 domain-containing protein [Alphaproteobacteria bacterium]|nr:DUF2608 domain-containing protein [Alphaproteobacteria bacterium]